MSSNHQRIIELLREHAADLKLCHCVGDDWRNEQDAKAAHDELLELAQWLEQSGEPGEPQCCCGETEQAWRLCPEHGPESAARDENGDFIQATAYDHSIPVTATSSDDEQSSGAQGEPVGYAPPNWTLNMPVIIMATRTPGYPVPVYLRPQKHGHGVIYQILTLDGCWEDVSKERFERESLVNHKRILYSAPAQQPAPEKVRQGAPYDDPAFESLCREHGIWGTAAAAQCAVFWLAGQHPAVPEGWQITRKGPVISVTSPDGKHASIHDDCCDEFCAPPMLRDLADTLLSAQQSAQVAHWPRVLGVSRVLDNGQSVLVSFTDVPTDDHLRALHDKLRAQAADGEGQ